MNVSGHDIGVCSWSLKQKSAMELVTILRQLGLSHIQLSLAELLELEDAKRDAELSCYSESGVEITAGMIHFPGEDYTSITSIKRTGGFMPDDFWAARRDLAFRAADFARSIGVEQVTTHVGFIPRSDDPSYGTMLARVREVAERYASLNLTLGMETGQETASELLQFINDLASENVFINFDPANMLLYGAGDPIDAIGTLGRHIGHVHIKDAVLSNQPGVVWGTEVQFGTGQVGPIRFIASLKLCGYEGPLVIEREAGEDRIGDIAAAVRILQQLPQR